MNNIDVALNHAIMAAISIVWNIKSILILVARIVVYVLWLVYQELQAGKLYQV